MTDFGVVRRHGTNSGKISLKHISGYKCVHNNDSRSPIIHQRNIIHKSFLHYTEPHYNKLTQSMNIGTTND